MESCAREEPETAISEISLYHYAIFSKTTVLARSMLSTLPPQDASQSQKTQADVAFLR